MSHGALPGLSRNCLVSPLRRSVGRVAVAMGLVQASSFAILAAAALVLNPEQFGEVGKAFAAMGMATVVMDLGVAPTVARFFATTGDRGYLLLGLRLHLCGCVAALLVAVCMLLGGMYLLALGVILGAMQTVWNNVRFVDLVQGDVDRYFYVSVRYSVVRVGLSLLCLGFAGSPTLLCVCMYGVPGLCATGVEIWRSFATKLPTTTISGSIVAYAACMYVTSVAFVACSYIPWLFIDGKSGVQCGSYSLIVALCGPVALLSQAVRSVILPRMAAPGSSLARQMCSWRGCIVAATLWCGLLGLAVAGSELLVMAYGDRYPGVQWVFVVYFGGYSGTAILGLFTTRMLHAGWIPACIAVARLLVLVFWLVGTRADLFQIVLAQACCMMGGEFVQAVAATYFQRQS